MQYIGMAIVGLIVGILARFFYPGQIQMGWIASIALGIGGSYVAGFIGNMLHKRNDGKVFHPAGFFY
ncbi:MAG: GlsB/YeaQ/YmgE family stress response membrane protein [Novosphingobium sp.]